MKIFLMEPHRVVFGCHENEPVKIKNGTEGGANLSVTSVNVK